MFLERACIIKINLTRLHMHTYASEIIWKGNYICIFSYDLTLNLVVKLRFTRKMDKFSSPSSDSGCVSGTSQPPLHCCGHCKRPIQTISETTPTCHNCRKVFYCSASHMKAHLAKHEKAGCIPAVIRSSSECGRYWVATRDIAIDEVIFTDKAIVLAPNVPCISPLYPTCLGCSRGTNTSYRCSKCGWPMCSKKCEKIPNHAKNECKVFRKNKIESNCRPQYYFFIQFLRALLLKENDPKAYAELMELEAHVKTRATVKEEAFMLNSFYKFLTQDCNLDYEYSLVDQIVGVNRVNCYSADGLIHGKKRFCTAVFPKLSLINHNCKPNTRTILHERVTGMLFMELRASLNIRQGEEISQQYITSTRGTFQRQQTLFEDWYFHCACERCKDVTELSTYFSALKCVNCSDGFLLPMDPMQLDSVWRCGVIFSDENGHSSHYVPEKGCGYSKNCENIRCLIEEIDRQMKLAEFNTKAMGRLLTDLISHSLHPNHYLIINIKFGLVDDVVRKLNYPAGQTYIEIEDILRAIRYTKDILAVTRVICPGRTYCVGVVLYFLASCLVELRRRNFPCKFTDAQMENVAKEAWIILHVEADGTSYRDMARFLEEKNLVAKLEKLSF